MEDLRPLCQQRAPVQGHIQEVDISDNQNTLKKSISLMLLTSVTRGKRNILTITSQILNTPQTSLPIRDRRIHIVLLPFLINAEPLEVYVASGSKLRFAGPGLVNW